MQTDPFLTPQRIFALIMVFVFGVAAVGGVVVTAYRNRDRPAVVTEYLRGSAILVIQLPQTGPLVEDIAVFEDGTAVRWFPQGVHNNGRTTVLSQEQRENINSLRTHWCETPPKVNKQGSDTLFYEVGIECSTYETKRVRLHPDQLPSPLAYLLDAQYQ